MTRLALMALCAFSLTACADKDDPNNRRPKISISILTDLSETWHNPSSDARNKRVLSAVGVAISGASNQLPSPLAVRFHVIGSGSLGREPVCSTLFRPSAFMIGKKDPGIIQDAKQFARYVQDECPDMLLSKPAEGATEISAAITTADRALRLTQAKVPKVYIVLSDFMEEAATSVEIEPNSLKGARFILVYRTLRTHQLDPALQMNKIMDWRRRLASLGAEVQVYDENAVVTSPRDFEAVIRTSAL